MQSDVFTSKVFFVFRPSFEKFRLTECVARKMRTREDARGQEDNSTGRYDTLRHALDGFPDRAVIWRRGASAARRVQVNGKNPV